MPELEGAAAAPTGRKAEKIAGWRPAQMKHSLQGKDEACMARDVDITLIAKSVITISVNS